MNWRSNKQGCANRKTTLISVVFHMLRENASKILWPVAAAAHEMLAKPVLEAWCQNQYCWRSSRGGWP